MTLFIPLGPIINNAWELRYALRSWEMYSPPDEVVIMGKQFPEWITGVTKYHIAGRPLSKPRDIYEKVKWMARVSGEKEFIFANDDHFLLKPFVDDPGYQGLIQDFKGGNETFMKYVHNTTRLFRAAKYFDVHEPMRMESKFVRQMYYPAQGEMLLKTAYGAIAGLNGRPVKDQKCPPHMRAPIDFGDRWCFSTSDVIAPDLRKWIEARYPDKSKYEI